MNVIDGMGQLGPLAGVMPGMPGDARRPDARADFASILGIADRGVSRVGGEAATRDAAEQFVAKAFIEPALAIARESNRLPPPLGPGGAEKQFASLIDAQRALDLVRSTRWPIVDRLVADLRREPEPDGAGASEARPGITAG